LDTRLLLRPRSVSTPRHCRLPGGCVMPHHVHERPPESRVREICTHGLKGGLAVTRRETGEG
jgi:hypothetical protein